MPFFNTALLLRLFSISILIALLNACGGGNTDKSPTVIPDTIAPVITLNGDAHITVFLNEAYTEQGASATDNVDGSVDVSITGEVNTAFYDTYTVTYSATDQAGNTSTVTRTVKILLPPDTQLPEVTINGDAYITLLLNEEYVEHGASALDQQEGELSVDTLGIVDISTAGTYTITYSATNSANVTGSVERVVVVASTEAFVTTWQTDSRVGTEDILATESNQIMISTFGDGYNYRVDWGDGQFDENVTGNITHTYESIGTYTVKITGDFPQLYFTSTEQVGGESIGDVYFDDSIKLRSVKQWGTNKWRSMNAAFVNAKYLTIDAQDTPDLSAVTDMRNMFALAGMYLETNQWNISDWDVSNVTDMKEMFYMAVRFNEDISDWDVSNVTNMRGMFSSADNFNQNISDWDVSNVTTMQDMFLSAENFNQNISDWDVSNVKDMFAMFSSAESFNQDISRWNVSSVTNMGSMFSGAVSFNQDISVWDVSSVESMFNMFSHASSFNQNLSSWDVSSVVSMSSMFAGTEYNQPLAEWDVSNVIGMFGMFNNAIKFNQDISGWNVSNVTDMSYMFSGAEQFNQDISNWDVSNVDDMNGMFSGASSFNHEISNWAVSNVRYMAGMFREAVAYNQNMNEWDVSNVINMQGMFFNATKFNQDINSWDVSKVSNMSYMFSNANIFNQDISNWNVSNVRYMDGMFKDAIQFEQNLGRWNVSNVTHMYDMFDGVTLRTANYDALLMGWSSLPLQQNVLFDGGKSKYSSSAEGFRDVLINNFNWDVSDGGRN